MSYTPDGNRIIIAISGKQLSGKDALAQILLELLPDFKRVGLGDAIKAELARRKNISVEELEKNKHLYRPELIDLGNWGRTQDEGLFWIKKVIEHQENIIVPDMRVKKEFDAFQNYGAVMIRVESDKANRLKRGTLVKEDDPTECALDNIKEWDVIVHNNQDLFHLKKEAQNIVNLIKTQKPHKKVQPLIKYMNS